MRSAEGFISAPGIIALCRDWRLAPRQGNLHFPCDSLRCLPFCVPHESEHLALQAIHFHGVLLTVSGGDTIAIYHCSIKIVSRGKGKSAVAAAAYRAGEKLTNEWDGLTHDYTRKGGVVHSEIMLPPHAPPSFSDRSILWNSVEQIEKSNNSQLAREIEIALPVELSREEQTRLVREYCSSQFVSKGMCADFNIHDTGNGNPHAHILLTMRPLDEKGTWAAKSKKEYVLDENGERVKLPSGRYKTRKVDLMDWNRQENADLWRKAWADLANDYLERSGSAERIDHRSHAERGIEELPTVHMGVAASQMEKKGIATDKGEINRMIQKTNRLMREIRGYIDSLKEWLAEVFAAKKQLQAAPHSPDIATLLTRYLSIEREKSRKYSQGWQQQHTAGELQKISKAIVYLQSKGIATLEDLDAALSSVDEEAKRLNTSVVAKQKRMRTLEKFIEHLSHLPVEVLTEEQLSAYSLYMRTLGNRPDLFGKAQYPNASTLKQPTYYDIPPEALKDDRFAAMMEEATKYIGYPYVWGGSSPSTSFDCSGYISWVLNHSGWNVGRQTAQGLYNLCTPVSTAQVKPGDLVFFKGTYDTPGVSHCGIYVGNSIMLHCGDPISYTNLNSKYWQEHFYSYGRLP